mmetsp:Transcript_11540/g.16938  ORF Transcript_11540/g.16938 Transcript_11540/m.16938 type:complete len:321 (-) Transcript_11540:142-1104(-)
MNDSRNDDSPCDGLKVDRSLLQPLQEQLVARFLSDTTDQENEESIIAPLCRDVGFHSRCLLARHNDFNKALTLATSCLRWRQSVQPSNLTTHDFATANSQECYEFAGHAKNGWPVILVKSHKWNPWKFSVAEYERQISFLIEHAERASDPCDALARAYIIFDMKGMSYLNSDLRKLRQLAKVCTVYYPERIGYAIACNADAVTYVLWKFIAPLVGKRIQDRVHIFRPGQHEDFIKEHLVAERIPPSLSGTVMTEEWPPITHEIADAYLWDPSIKSTAAVPAVVESTVQRVSCSHYISVATDNRHLYWTGVSEITTICIKS